MRLKIGRKIVVKRQSYVHLVNNTRGKRKTLWTFYVTFKPLNSLLKKKNPLRIAPLLNTISLSNLCFSGASAAKRSPISKQETKGNPWVDFLIVIMASGIARGRVRTTTTATVESRKMAASVLLWHWTSMLWSTDTCQNKVSADQYHLAVTVHICI